MQRNTDPIFSFTDKLRSAVRTRRKLHLTSDEVAILLDPDVIDAINRLEAAAMRSTCELATANDNSLGIITCGIEPVPEPGRFVGSNGAEMELLSRGASLRLSEAMMKATRRGKPSTP